MPLGIESLIQSTLLHIIQSIFFLCIKCAHPMASKILIVLGYGFKEEDMAYPKAQRDYICPNRRWGDFLSAMTRNHCRCIISQRWFSPVCLFHSWHLSWHLIVFQFNKGKVITSVCQGCGRSPLLILAVCLEAITDRTIIPGKLISVPLHF